MSGAASETHQPAASIPRPVAMNRVLGFSGLGVGQGGLQDSVEDEVEREAPEDLVDARRAHREYGEEDEQRPDPTRDHHVEDVGKGQEEVADRLEEEPRQEDGREGDLEARDAREGADSFEPLEDEPRAQEYEGGGEPEHRRAAGLADPLVGDEGYGKSDEGPYELQGVLEHDQVCAHRPYLSPSRAFDIKA